MDMAVFSAMCIGVWLSATWRLYLYSSMNMVGSGNRHQRIRTSLFSTFAVLGCVLTTPPGSENVFYVAALLMGIGTILGIIRSIRVDWLELKRERSVTSQSVT